MPVLESLRDPVGAQNAYTRPPGAERPQEMLRTHFRFAVHGRAELEIIRTTHWIQNPSARVPISPARDSGTLGFGYHTYAMQPEPPTPTLPRSRNPNPTPSITIETQLRIPFSTADAASLRNPHHPPQTSLLRNPTPSQISLFGTPPLRKSIFSKYNASASKYTPKEHHLHHLKVHHTTLLNLDRENQCPSSAPVYTLCAQSNADRLVALGLFSAHLRASNRKIC